MTLPVENMPILRGREVYRMPSVTSISETMGKNQYRKRQVGSSEIQRVDPLDAFVLINPDTTLPLCGDYLEWYLKDRGLEVYTGVEVQPFERLADLLGKKIFTYIWATIPV
ncbi:putative separase [Rosa chinensis]|uniref:Putative separase n=1 Tax=Rosa chinensis TaxID=74649 RepID=A0A2P6QZU9_ROSCH|nr:putative separase [Rosa chinensis]